jgi:branched-chain amino acid transport system permease protein
VTRNASIPGQCIEESGVGGLYASRGPTVGAVIAILLAEILRIGFDTKAVGWDNLVYGVLLVVFIIFVPKGILGSIAEKVKARRRPKKAQPSSIEGANKTHTFRI